MIIKIKYYFIVFFKINIKKNIFNLISISLSDFKIVKKFYILIVLDIILFKILNIFVYNL